MKKILYEFITIAMITISILLISNAGVLPKQKELPQNIQSEIKYQRSDDFKNNKKNNLPPNANFTAKFKNKAKEQTLKKRTNFIDPKAAKPVFIGNGKTKCNLNTANANKLMNLKGVGKVTAKKIVKYRQENGAFLSIDELIFVKGIGAKKIKLLKNQTK